MYPLWYTLIVPFIDLLYWSSTEQSTQKTVITGTLKSGSHFSCPWHHAGELYTAFTLPSYLTVVTLLRKSQTEADSLDTRRPIFSIRMNDWAYSEPHSKISSKFSCYRFAECLFRRPNVPRDTEKEYVMILHGKHNIRKKSEIVREITMSLWQREVPGVGYSHGASGAKAAENIEMPRNVHCPAELPVIPPRTPGPGIQDLSAPTPRQSVQKARSYRKV